MSAFFSSFRQRFHWARELPRPILASGRSVRAVRVLLLCLLYLSISGCALFQKIANLIPMPDLRLDRVEFAGLDLRAVTLRFHLELENPYPFAIPRAGFDLGLSAEKKEFTRLKTTLAKGISAQTTVPVSLDARIPFRALVDLAKARFRSLEFFSLGLQGGFDVYLPTDDLPDIVKKSLPKQSNQATVRKFKDKYFQKYTFDVALDKKVPAVLPDVKVSHFQIQRPSLSDIRMSSGKKSSTVSSYLSRLLGKGRFPGSPSKYGLGSVDLDLKTSFDIELSNQAKAALELLGADYELEIAGRRLFRGKALNIRQVAGKSLARVETSFSLRSISLGLARAIHSGTAPVRLRGTTYFRIPGWDQSLPLRFSFDQRQQLSW